MEHINRIEIQGEVGNIRTQTIFDQQVANMSVMTQEFYKSKEDMVIADTTWHNVVVWQDKSLSDLSKVEKGSKVRVVGRLRQMKYTDANGMEKVHFLNKVDEKDLLNVMAEEEVEEYLSQTENAEIVPEDEDVLNEPELEQTEPVETEPEIVGLPPVTSLLLISGVLGIGSLVGYLYLKKKKAVRPAEASADNEEDEDIPEDLDETEFDDEDLDVDEEE